MTNFKAFMFATSLFAMTIIMYAQNGTTLVAGL